MLKIRQLNNVMQLQRSIISTTAWNSKDSSSDDSSDCSKSGGNTISYIIGNYGERKYGHELPTDSVKPYFKTLPGIPTGVFRETTGEVLGQCAGKGECYKNPEYFSFHHMSFYDMHVYLRLYRNASPKTGRKP